MTKKAKQTAPNVKDPYAISCDWLSVYCLSTNSINGEIGHLTDEKFRFKQTQNSSRQFRYITNVYTETGDLYAVIQTCPYSSIINPLGAIIKLHNRELYKHDFARRLQSFMRRYGFIYRNISRLDVAFDCNTFKKGLHARRIINRLVGGKLVKNHQGKARLEFDTSNPKMFQGITFGSSSSAVTVVLYNKTKELKEVKDKPYIRERWRKNGIDETREVWRVEIRIKPDATHLINTGTGELFRLEAEHLKMQHAIERVFFVYAAKYFAFKIVGRDKNKSRLRDLEIFDPPKDLTTIPTRITNASDTTRADKIFLKKLCNIVRELREVPDELKDAVEFVRNCFCMQKSLTRYYYQVVEPSPYERG